MLSRSSLISLLLVLVVASLALAQNSEQLQVGPPARRAEPPEPAATAAELEQRGDQLRTEKAYLDAIDYYQAALKKKPLDVSGVYNKLGICELQLQRFKEARKDFERAIKADRKHADAYNNLGFVYYQAKYYNKAIKLYEQAIALRSDAASFYNNLGAAYFAKKDFDNAILNYAKALQLDPDIFERTSRSGVQVQLHSPEDQARYDYVLAKLYAKMGASDRSLHYLKKAMEEGYKDIGNVYKDAEFTELRKDPRFATLMAAKPPAIQE